MTASSLAPQSPTLNATKATPNKRSRIAFRACADACQITLPDESIQCAFTRPLVGDYGNVDLSVFRVGDVLHILSENAAVFPNSLSGDRCLFSPVTVSHESSAIFRRTGAPEVDRIEARHFRT